MNDLIYNEIVATPGYEPEFAVGTTYSLDAEAFLALALSFARLGDATEADFQSPFRLLEGIRQANSRVAVFCNRGGLMPPARTNPLYAMLDKSVFEVSDDSHGNELANFHPKIWVIKERSLDNHDRRQIKLIVMSRNLTKDTSLDVAATMVAQIGTKAPAELQRKHQPLKDLLIALAEKASPGKKKEIRKLAKEIDLLGPFDLEAPYEDYEFVPIHFGVNLNPRVDLETDLPGERMAVVSPFIDAPTLEWLNRYRGSQAKILITRLDSLTPEIMQIYSADNREVWVVSQIAEQNDVQPMNLHAKMYFSWHPAQGGNYLWLGSANATKNGFHKNSEFLLRLSLKRGNNQFENFKAEFCDEKKQLCERIDKLPESEPSGEDNSLSVSVRTSLIFRNNLKAEVIASGDKYNIIITAGKANGIPGRITFAPIQEPWNEAEMSPDSRQCEIHTTVRSHLSEFYILRVEPFDKNIAPLKMAVKIPTKGIPSDRDDCIFRSLIDTREKFLNYVEMMITDCPQELAELMIPGSESGADGAKDRRLFRSNAQYESLLRIAATNPGRLEEVLDVANRVGGDVVPESFAQMLAKFKQSIKLIR